MGRAERVVDEHVAELGERRAELLDRLGVGLGLVAVLVLARALLLDVEAQVLEEEDVAVLGRGDRLLRVGADALGQERDRLAREEALELGSDGLERVLLDGGAVGAAEVRHEDDRLGALVNCVLDGRERSSDALCECECEATCGKGGRTKEGCEGGEEEGRVSRLRANAAGPVALAPPCSAALELVAHGQAA